MGVTEYAIIVVAENTAGLRKASERVLRSTASQAEAPGAPQNVVGTPRSTGITVTWEEPKTLGKTKEGKPATITGYTVYYKKGTGITDDDITNINVNDNVKSVESTATEAILFRLTGGTQYAIVVRAKNNVGMSSTNAAITSTTLSLAKAAEPMKGLTVTQPNAASEVSVLWEHPQDKGKTKEGERGNDCKTTPCTIEKQQKQNQ